MGAKEGDETVTSVLVVDDQALYREGLISLMGHWPDFRVLGEASNGQEAIEFCQMHAPDLVLMDVRMPVMGGIEATKIIRQRFPDVVVIMLTVSAGEEDLINAFYSGASGYVLKDLPSSQLRACLQGAVRGDAVLSGSVTSMVIKKALRNQVGMSSAEHADGRTVPLSAREIEILRLVAQGLSNDEIGAHMYVSSGTVKKSLQALMQKLSLSNRVMLAVYAIRSGLLD